MKSYVAKKEEVARSWKLVDAEGQILGRLASKVAMILMGKTKPTYTPNVDTGDYVVIVNAEKVKVTGNKELKKEYDRFSGYPGGRKVSSYAEVLERHPERILTNAIRLMLPKNRLGKEMLDKLKVYAGPEHNHSAQKPEKIEL
ncbi:50S ribosomal protein L13 [Anaerohalosphaera lusitana]|uniref:Large ribosomal subunit protein uL13 n=1 Tax=Anaerohalosphaera lusitana TaxID=1936003 RepID=A0A1U9NIP1_9BACT|nr:50S ribosomal protein L13 [Anaerohalosphaera lusitana]AQT67460.1 50S ribosomal protein L13 [Anaerohalosphaera lusitana]